jgi:hypothetical protein
MQVLHGAKNAILTSGLLSFRANGAAWGGVQHLCYQDHQLTPPSQECYVELHMSLDRWTDVHGLMG